MGLEFISGPNSLDTDIAHYYCLDLNEMSIPEVTEVDISWEGGVTMKVSPYSDYGYSLECI